MILTLAAAVLAAGLPACALRTPGLRHGATKFTGTTNVPGVDVVTPEEANRF